MLPPADKGAACSNCQVILDGGRGGQLSHFRLQLMTLLPPLQLLHFLQELPPCQSLQNLQQLVQLSEPLSKT